MPYPPPKPPFPELQVLDQRLEAHSASWQMAVDEALVREVGPVPILRCYRWETPVLSFGYFQKFTDLPSNTLLPAQRRWTGGGLVEHAEDFAYSLILPLERQHPSPQSFYETIHRCLAWSLRQLGIPAILAESASGAGSACFQHPVPADVLCDGQKIAGAAQRRCRHGVLHQGSVRLSLPDLAATFAQSLSCRTTPRGLDATTRCLAETLNAEKYATRAWERLR